MNNFITRALTGVVFVIVLAGSIFYGTLSTGILFLLIGILGYTEYQKLTSKEGGSVIGFVVYTSITALVWVAILMNQTQLLLPLLALFFIIELLRFIFTDDLKLHAFGKETFGFIYLNLAFVSLYFLGFSEGETYNPWPILMVFFMVWSNDTGAYLVGRAIGKNKMIEKLSPKKTWEGTIGGLVIAMAVGYSLATFVFDFNGVYYAIAGVLTGVAATLGDLVESKLKRLAGIKDSGNILPGHGGILDRFDAMYLAGPLNYILFTLVI